MDLNLDEFDPVEDLRHQNEVYGNGTANHFLDDLLETVKFTCAENTRFCVTGANVFVRLRQRAQELWEFDPDPEVEADYRRQHPDRAFYNDLEVVIEWACNEPDLRHLGPVTRENMFVAMSRLAVICRKMNNQRTSESHDVEEMPVDPAVDHVLKVDLHNHDAVYGSGTKSFLDDLLLIVKWTFDADVVVTADNLFDRLHQLAGDVREVEPDAEEEAEHRHLHPDRAIFDDLFEVVDYACCSDELAMLGPVTRENMFLTVSNVAFVLRRGKRIPLPKGDDLEDLDIRNKNAVYGNRSDDVIFLDDLLLVVEWTYSEDDDVEVTAENVFSNLREMCQAVREVEPNAEEEASHRRQHPYRAVGDDLYEVVDWACSDTLKVLGPVTRENMFAILNSIAAKLRAGEQIPLPKGDDLVVADFRNKNTVYGNEQKYLDDLLVVLKWTFSEDDDIDVTARNLFVNLREMCLLVREVAPDAEEAEHRRLHPDRAVFDDLLEVLDWACSGTLEGELGPVTRTNMFTILRRIAAMIREGEQIPLPKRNHVLLVVDQCNKDTVYGNGTGNNFEEDLLVTLKWTFYEDVGCPVIAENILGRLRKMCVAVREVVPDAKEEAKHRRLHPERGVYNDLFEVMDWACSYTLEVLGPVTRKNMFAILNRIAARLRSGEQIPLPRGDDLVVADLHNKNVIYGNGTGNNYLDDLMIVVKWIFSKDVGFPVTAKNVFVRLRQMCHAVREIEPNVKEEAEHRRLYYERAVFDDLLEVVDWASSDTLKKVLGPVTRENMFSILYRIAGKLRSGERIPLPWDDELLVSDLNNKHVVYGIRSGYSYMEDVMVVVGWLCSDDYEVKVTAKTMYRRLREKCLEVRDVDPDEKKESEHRLQHPERASFDDLFEVVDWAGSDTLKEVLGPVTRENMFAVLRRIASKLRSGERIPLPWGDEDMPHDK